MYGCIPGYSFVFLLFLVSRAFYDFVLDVGRIFEWKDDADDGMEDNGL